MSASISVTEIQVFSALRAVLGTMGLVSSTSGQDVPIIRGQVNRVPEPSQSDFVIMWPLFRHRLAYNSDAWEDSIVTGSITSNILTVSVVQAGAVLVGAPVRALAVLTPLCTVTSQLTGSTGSIGTYAVTTATDRASGTLYVGTQTVMEPVEMTVQIDVHGPPAKVAGDNAQRIATLMQDQYGVQAFLDTGGALAPLFCTMPRMMPFDNDQKQIEERWTFEVALQINPIVTVTGQFADTLEIDTVSVEAAYPV